MESFARFVLCLFLCSFLAACHQINYLGDNYAPTHEVKFFYNEKDIPSGAYVTMGRCTVSISRRSFSESVVGALREKAMEVGADAILVKGFIEPKNPAAPPCCEDPEYDFELRAEFLKKI